MDSIALQLLCALAIGYLLGSIPFGLLLTRRAGLGDVRDIGSGNIGATNVLRTGNKSLAALTLVADLLKGTAAVGIAASVATHFFQVNLPTAHLLGLAAGFAAFLGHLFPAWLGFKGGKGVATYIGVLLGVSVPLALTFCGIWLIVALIARYSSLAALVASIATPFIALVLPRTAMVLYVPTVLFVVLLMMTFLLLWKHRENIARLRRGEETKIGQKD